jgi:hypothetical protein
MIPETLPKRRVGRRLAKDAALRKARALTGRRCELGNSRREAVLVELPQPIRWGWERYFFVRPELAHTTEGPALEAVLRFTQNLQWSNRKDFAERDWRRGGKKRPTAHRLRQIPEEKFWEEVPRELHRYFEPVTHRDKVGGGVRVSVTFAVKNPEVRFVSRLRPYYMTHRALPHSEADSEIALVESKLYGPGDWLMRHLIRWQGEYKDDWDRGPNGIPPLVEPEDVAGLPNRMAQGISRQ